MGEVVLGAAAAEPAAGGDTAVVGAEAAARNAQEGALAADLPAGRPLNVLLMISSLEYGGAERQVVQLANYLPRERFNVSICSLSPLVPLAEGLHDRGQLHIVEKRSKYDFSTVGRAAKLMRRLGTDVVHAFLFDAEMVARLAARRGGASVMIASERNTDYVRPLVHSIALRLTRGRADAMIANSNAGKLFNMRTLGLPDEHIHVVHNGVDVSRFRPTDPSIVRRELGIAPTDRVIGMVANFKRQKNHAAFFRMAEALLKRYPDCWFLCVGEPLRDNAQGAEDYHREMRQLLATMSIEPRTRFLGKRQDMPEVYSACDVTVLTSEREGTPNVLLESMACGVPVVATNVADNAYVVPEGRVGHIVPLNDVPAMVERVAGLLDDPARRRAMGDAARAWVESEFSIAALVRKTGAIYETLYRRKRAQRGG